MLWIIIAEGEAAKQYRKTANEQASMLPIIPNYRSDSKLQIQTLIFDIPESH